VAFGNMALWLVLSLVTALYAPGASPLFVIPLLQMSALVLVASRLGDTPRLRYIVALLALLIITPTTIALVPLLLETQGYRLVAVAFPFMALFGAMLLCLNAGSEPGVVPAGRKTASVAALLAVVLFVTVVLMNMYSSWRPQDIVLSYLEDRATGKAHWVARSPEDIPEHLIAVGNLAETDSPVMPYFGSNPGPAAVAGITATPAPTLTVISDNWNGKQRTVNLQLKSQRQARQLTLRVSSTTGLTAATANGQTLELRDLGYEESELGKHYGITTFTTAPYGVLIQLQFDNSAEQMLYFSDSTTELPESGSKLVAARNILGAPTHRGDQWVIQDELRLGAIESGQDKRK